MEKSRENILKKLNTLRIPKHIKHTKHTKVYPESFREPQKNFRKKSSA